ncbi:3-demethylubiquinone-9 3-methyltransferase [Ensifer adhaerens]|uniref:3-demethylubiquinone-9 3-methyltransferase n=1 Tax=Ensifer adhaerens TaxID=106592 RepID=A0A0L8BEG1_ENSAD|nr:VOC family protein [Ensifer adhaerens]KOF13008.1 3-demethylubiquinone-9 3-methyltransferase [Ensifer adhaerens]
MTNVVSNLWFEKDALDAVEFYISVVPNSAIIRTTTLPAESPSGPADSVKLIEFTLGNQQFMALEAGPLDPFNHAFSIVIQCDSQEEIDRLWNALLENGGEPEQCGWIRDRWGLCWQIVPRALGDMIAHSDRDRARRAAEAMLGMIKLDIAALERAFHSHG